MFVPEGPVLAIPSLLGADRQRALRVELTRSQLSQERPLPA